MVYVFDDAVRAVNRNVRGQYDISQGPKVRFEHDAELGKVGRMRWVVDGKYGDDFDLAYLNAGLDPSNPRITAVYNRDCSLTMGKVRELEQFLRERGGRVTGLIPTSENDYFNIFSGYPGSYISHRAANLDEIESRLSRLPSLPSSSDQIYFRSAHFAIPKSLVPHLPFRRTVSDDQDPQSQEQMKKTWQMLVMAGMKYGSAGEKPHIIVPESALRAKPVRETIDFIVDKLFEPLPQPR